MPYVKTTWKDQKVETPRTYSVRKNLDETVTLLDHFGNVEEVGTPVNATNMNKIEDGIYNVDKKVDALPKHIFLADGRLPEIKDDNTYYYLPEK